MSDTTAEVMPESTEPAGDGDTPGGHPAWAELYEAIPSDLHPLVKPYLDKADLTTQQGFAKYEPWKDVIESHDPQVVANALTFMQQLDQDPARVYAAIGQAYNLATTPEPQESTAPAPTPTAEASIDVSQLDMDDPMQAALATALGKLSQFEQFMAQQNQSSADAQAMQQLETTLEFLKGKHGDFDREFVLGLMGAGIDPNQAVLRYKEFVGRVAGNTTTTTPPATEQTPPPVAPPVSGSTGALPAPDPVEPGKLKSSEIEDLVNKILNTNN